MLLSVLWVLEVIHCCPARAQHPLNTEYGNGPYYTENDPIYLPVIRSIFSGTLQATNSLPAATFACTKSIICMGAGLACVIVHRGGAAHAQYRLMR